MATKSPKDLTHAGAQYRRVVALLIALIPCWLVAAELTARLERDRIRDGETAVLELTVEGSLSSSPDLSPLLGDFVILGQRQSSSISMVYGQSRRQTRTLRLELQPLRTGKLSVPSLHLGTASSQPLELTVLATDQVPADTPNQPVYVEVEASPDDPYVLGRIIYRVRLLHRVSLIEPTLSDPEARDATIERMGEDRGYKLFVHGSRYQVIERRFAIIPQRSGTLEITGPRFTTRVPAPDRRPGGTESQFDNLPGFDTFGQAQLLTGRGRTMSFDVREKPPGAGVPWVPALSVQLSDAWNPSDGEIRVGQPVTRTLAITAQGLISAQLPDLTMADIPGLRVYPEQPRVQDLAGGEDLVAVKEIKTALIPTHAGPVILPEIRLAWWDVAVDEPREAVIPSRTLQVLPAVAAAPVPEAVQPRVEPRSAEVEPLMPLPKEVPPGESVGPVPDLLGAHGYWPWIALVLGLAWLSTLLLWGMDRSRRRRRMTGRSSAGTGALSMREAFGQVRRACRAEDPRAAREALIVWGNARWPDRPPVGLAQLGARLNAESEQVSLELDRRLYGAAGGDWNGRAAWAVLKRALDGQGKADHDRSDGDPLPQLYPPIS